MRGRFLLAGWLVVALLLGPPWLLAADEDASRLRLLGQPEHEGHAAALASWNQEALGAKVDILRRALFSEDVGLATLAAEALGAEYLDGEELRRKMDLLLARPATVFQTPTQRHEWALGDGLRPWGSDDLLPFFRQAVTRETCDDLSLTSWHRVLLPEHVAGLVPLLDDGSPKMFRTVLWLVMLCGRHDREDHHRAEVARGLCYGLERLRAERAGEPVPPLPDGRVDIESRPDGGLPDAYVELMRACWPVRKTRWRLRLDADGPLSDVEGTETKRWLRRWTRDLTPSGKDLPFLVQLVESILSSDTAMLRWAMGHAADLPGERGQEHVRAWAGQDGEEAIAAAAVLAERGEPAPYLALLRQPEEGDPTLERPLWTVDPAGAREAWVAFVLEHEPGDFRDGLELDAEARRRKEILEDLVVTDDDMAWIADALWTRDASTGTLAWFYTAVWPEGLTTARMKALVARLEAWEAQPSDERSLTDLLPLLARIEVRDEAMVIRLLRGWAESQPAHRANVLPWLARLGDAKHAAQMTETWEDWMPWDWWILGRVDCDVVRDFLRRRVEEDDPERSPAALIGLLVQAGLPDACARSPSWTWDPLPEVRRLLLAGDLEAAVRHAAEVASPACSRATLGRQRATREDGRYWEATVGMATQRDATVTPELRRFLEEDRLWVIEDLDEDVWALPLAAERGVSRTLPDHWMVHHWLDRLDTNCCLGFRAMVSLRAIFPTIPFLDGYGGAGTRRTRDWVRRHTWAWSRLLDGWVPAGR